MYSNYIEFKIKDNSCIPHNFIMNRIMCKLHGVFSQQKKEHGKVLTPVGFPNYSKINLGNIIRVFGNKNDLQNINSNDIVKAIGLDYVIVSEIRDIPNQTKQIVYKRVRLPIEGYNSSLKATIRKYGEEKANKNLEFLSKQKKIKLPYIECESGSNKNKYSVFIKKSNILNGNNISTFGLNALVPDF